MIGSSAQEPRHDVVVIGAGPTGSTAAIVLARAGLDVLLLERQRFPRFHIGESLLPENMRLFRDLGLEERLRSLPHIDKHGVEFSFGHENRPTLFQFENCMQPSETAAINLERAPFDAMLLDEAGRAGATVVQNRAARECLRLEDGDVRLVIGDDEVRARYVVDASGQSTFLAKHLGIRRVLQDLKKVSYFGHFRNVERNPGLQEGDPSLIMMDDGWFWVIPLDRETTSIGLVMHHQHAERAGIPADEMLAWGIARCPLLQQRTANAVFPERYHVAADFSYHCRPFAGPGYFLAGDAATFVDPIFSTGVCLGMMSGAKAAHGIVGIVRDGARPAAVRRSYVRYVEKSTSPLFRLVRGYYDHHFRELLLQGSGPLDVHRAITTVLAGNVFPSLRWSLSWRLWMFEAFRRIQRFVPLVPRRESRSLFDSEPGATCE